MTRAVGIDISKWDVSFNPDLTATPPDFVIQRAAYGFARDSLFDALNVGVQKIGVRGAYQYLLSGAKWMAQADEFLSIIYGNDFHFSVCDFEGTNNALSIDFAAAAMEWCAYVKQQTGKPVVIYSNYSAYVDYLSKDARVKLYPFWIARPLASSIPDPQTYNPVMPPMRLDWTFCQYSFGEHNTFGPANGVGRTGVDVDVYNGTLDQLRAWLGLGTVTPPAELTDHERIIRLENAVKTHGIALP